jgi:hypothetical protein
VLKWAVLHLLEYNTDNPFKVRFQIQGLCSMGVPKSERRGFQSRSGRLFIELDEQVSGHYLIASATHAPKGIYCPN